MKLKYLILLVVLSIMMGINISCNNEATPSKGNYLAVKQENDELWSLVAPNGSMLFVNEFKQNISDAVEGLFLVPEDSLKSLYKATSVPIPLNDYVNLLDVGEPSEGKVVLIDNDRKIMAIKTSGEVLFSLPPDIIACHASFKNGLLGVCDEKALWGFVNEKGEQVIPCKYITVTPFSEGHSIIAEYKNDRIKLSIIDKSGNVTAVVKNYLYLIASSTEFHNGRIPVVNIDEQFGFLTVDGIFEKCSYKVTGITNVNDYGFIFQKSDGRYGAMDYKGEILVQPRYDDLSFIPGTRNYIAKINNKYSELDERGEKIMDFDDYKYVQPGTLDFPIIASTGNRYELLNANGTPVSKTDFADINTKVNFSKNILYPSDTDLFRFNFEIANYLDQVFQDFQVQTPNTLDNIEETDSIKSEINDLPVEVVEPDPTIKTPKITKENKIGASPTSNTQTPVSEKKQPSTGTTGSYNYGYATYSGQLKDGKPNGRGKLTFVSSHTDNVRNYEAQKGDYIEGYFTNGLLDNGSLYKSDGSKIKTIY